LIWSEKIVLPPQFVSGLNVLEVALVKSGVAFIKDTVNVDLDSHKFPKDFQVPLAKIKGTLHFTIDVHDGDAAPKKSSDRKAVDRLSLSPRASRKLAAALETEKHGSAVKPASSSSSSSSDAGPPLPSKSSDTSLSAGEQQAIIRREREVARREEDLVRREEALKSTMAGLSKKDEVPSSWKKYGSAFEKKMVAERERLHDALAKLDFSACHDIINNMAESWEENGGEQDTSSRESSSFGANSSVLNDAPDLAASLQSAVNTQVSPRMPPPMAARPLAGATLPKKAGRTIADVERDISFAVGAGDFNRAIELREELKRLGGGPPAADTPPMRPPKAVGGSFMRGSQSERSGSGVVSLTSGGSDAEIDAEIQKLTTALTATKALADKWAAIGNNGARQAAEDQVTQMQREISDLQAKKSRGGGGGGGIPPPVDQYQALPANAGTGTINVAAALAGLPPPPSPMGAASGGSAVPPRPAMRPPPRPALAGRLPPSRLPPMAGRSAGPSELPPPAALSASLPPPSMPQATPPPPMPAVPDIIPAASSGGADDDPFVGKDISGPMLTIRSAKSMQAKLAAGGSARGTPRSTQLTTAAAAAPPGAAPATTAAEKQSRRRSQSLNSLMAQAKGAVPQVSTVAMSKAMKATGAGEPEVDAMQSQEQRELVRLNAIAPSAELADKYIVTDEQASVAIPSCQSRGSGRSEYTVYQVDVKRGNTSWTVFRRFQQFEDLREKLKRSVPSGVPPDFPPKEGDKKNAGVIELRRRELEKFLQALHEHPGTLASADFRTFLAPTQLGDIKPKN
jgi:hypothetical protein